MYSFKSVNPLQHELEDLYYFFYIYNVSYIYIKGKVFIFSNKIWKKMMKFLLN